jgi:hypothetical protein
MKKTRKYKSSRNKQKTRGGMGMAASMASKMLPSITGSAPPPPLNKSASAVKTLTTMFTYGISAILVGPLYLLAELLNLPLTSLNALSRKAFDDNKKHSFLHVPMYKMISGCPIKTLEPSNFVLQDDMYINNNVSVVSCDSKGANTGEVEDYSTSFSDTILDTLGVIRSKRKLRHHVFRLFDYIENIRETDEARKEHIQKLIKKISDYKVLLRCYVIYRSMSNKCPQIKRGKTVLKDEDIVNIVNPYYVPGPISYTKRVSCVYKHLTKKRFDKEEVADCKATCDTCTFRNSLSRLTNKYTSMFSIGGCRISIVKSMINAYYDLLSVTPGTLPLPVDEKAVIRYLDSLKIVSKINGSLVDEKMVLEKFNTFMCKYDIIDTVKEQIERKIKENLEAGYPMDKLMHSVERI